MAEEGERGHEAAAGATREEQLGAWAASTHPCRWRGRQHASGATWAVPRVLPRRMGQTRGWTEGRTGCPAGTDA